MARPGDISKIVAPSGEIEIFEFSCTVILRNEGEDIPLDTFPFGKGNALAHYLKLMPYRVEVVGALANPPEHWGARYIYGGHERPVKLAEALREMATRRQTVQYVTPSFPGFVMEDLILEDVAITAQNKDFNVYDVRIQMKNVLFYNSLADLLNVMGQAFAKAYGILRPVAKFAGGVAGSLAGAFLGASIVGPLLSPFVGPAAGDALGALSGAIVGAMAGVFAGEVAAVVISGGAALGAVVLHLLGLLPAQRGSLPWQKFTTPILDRGDYEFEIYPHMHGYPMISVRKDGYSIIENRPIRMGENVLAEVQYDELAKGLYLVAVPLVEGVWDVTNDNFGKETGLYIATVEPLAESAQVPAGAVRLEV
jgi:hypothetical protein